MLAEGRNSAQWPLCAWQNKKSNRAQHICGVLPTIDSLENTEIRLRSQLSSYFHDYGRFLVS